MSANLSRRWAACRRFLASWYAPAAVVLLLLLALAAWAVPRRVERAVTDTATGEVRTLTAWDTANWQALAAFRWQALVLGLVLLALFLAAWSGRGWVLRAAAAARFFAASLLLHGLLVLWMWGAPLARSVVAHAQTIRVSQYPELFEEEPQPSGPPDRPAYEKVADVGATKAAVPDLVRQAPAPANVPDDAGPLVPTLPAHAARGLPPERVQFVPPRLPDVVRRSQEIARQSAASVIKPAAVELEMPEPPTPEATPKEEPPGVRPVTQPRRNPVAPAPDGPASMRLPDMPRTRPADLQPEAIRVPLVRAPGSMPDPLVGHRAPGPIALAVPREPEARLKAGTPPRDRPPADVRVVVPRLTPPSLTAPKPDELTGPPKPLPPPVRLGTTIPRRLDMPSPAIRPPAGRLARTPAGTGRLAGVEETVAPPVAFSRRPKEVRQDAVERYGGSKASEAAVERGLDWLAAHQNANGSWSLHDFHANCKHPRCPDVGTVRSDPAATGLALLPFLGAGHTHQAGKHQKTVARALRWLVGQQKPDGTWPAPGDARPMYGHGIASIALCEAYGMTQDPKLRGPARKALDYIVRAQHAPSGGWRYQPNQPADTSVVGWQLMALKSGEMAGLPAPVKALDGVKRWLASVESNRPVGGRFGYQSANPISPAMTAQGLLCLQYLGTRRDHPRMRAGTDYLLAHLPRQGVETSYYWYHATQVMYHMQGRHWKAWNGKLRDLLVSTQETRGALAGSWKPTDQREKPGGRLYATALRLLMLEVYYRHLPLYQQLER